MTYEYLCTACGHAWEAEQSISAAPLTTCPHCHAESAKRQVSGGAGFILKGGGWYSDLYASSGAKKSGGDGESKTSDSTSKKESSSDTTAKSSEKGSSGSSSGSGSTGSSGSGTSGSTPTSGGSSGSKAAGAPSGA